MTRPARALLAASALAILGPIVAVCLIIGAGERHAQSITKGWAR